MFKWIQEAIWSIEARQKRTSYGAIIIKGSSHDRLVLEILMLNFLGMDSQRDRDKHTWQILNKRLKKILKHIQEQLSSIEKRLKNGENIGKLRSLLESLEKPTWTGSCTQAFASISSSSHAYNVLDIA